MIITKTLSTPMRAVTLATVAAAIGRLETAGSPISAQFKLDTHDSGDVSAVASWAEEVDDA